MKTAPTRLHAVPSTRNVGRPSKFSLLALAREQLRIARHGGGTSWTQIAGDQDAEAVRVTVIALSADTELATDDPRCGVGSHVQVLQGIVAFHRTRTTTSVGWPSDLLALGDDVQRLRARSDAVILVTTFRPSSTTDSLPG